eukprot:4320774-Amphidinium_carterae.2
MGNLKPAAAKLEKAEITLTIKHKKSRNAADTKGGSRGSGVSQREVFWNLSRVGSSTPRHS